MLGVHRVTFAKLYLQYILISSYVHSVDLYGKCREISYIAYTSIPWDRISKVIHAWKAWIGFPFGWWIAASQDYYDILEVPKNASEEAAKKARGMKMYEGTRCFFSGRIIRVFPKIGGYPPKSSILIGISKWISIIFTIHFGVPLFLETPIWMWMNAMNLMSPPENLVLLRWREYSSISDCSFPVTCFAHRLPCMGMFYNFI